MNKIFISYRRDDSADVTGRIFDRLSSHFHKEEVFKDVDSIPLGEDFRKSISDAVLQCNVVLAIIGKRWLYSKDNGKISRLSDPDDFVRIELEASLERNIPVIPVLVSNANVPGVSELPDSLQLLVYRNAISVRSDPDFNIDIQRLIRALEKILTDSGITKNKKVVKSFYASKLSYAFIVFLVLSVSIFLTYRYNLVDFYHASTNKAKVTVEPDISFSSLPLSTRVARVIEQLDANKEGDFDLQTRLAAIARLRLLVEENPPQDYYLQASEILTTYVRTNVDDRKRSGPGIKKDRGTFLAEDIIAALKALQILRETSKAPIRILLTGIDFDNINLAPPGGLDLSYFDFSYSTFNHSFLSGCKCRYTNFSFATFHSAAIWNADFAHANFKKANLSGAKFANVNFQGSNIEEASNLNVQVFAEPKGLTEHQRSLLP